MFEELVFQYAKFSRSNRQLGIEFLIFIRHIYRKILTVFSAYLFTYTLPVRYFWLNVLAMLKSTVLAEVDNTV
jgi:hypothetical protein